MRCQLELKTTKMAMAFYSKIAADKNKKFYRIREGYHFANMLAVLNFKRKKLLA